MTYEQARQDAGARNSRSGGPTDSARPRAGMTRSRNPRHRRRKERDGRGRPRRRRRARRIMGDIKIGGSTAGGGGELGQNPAQGVSAQSFTQGPGMGRRRASPWSRRVREPSRLRPLKSPPTYVQVQERVLQQFPVAGISPGNVMRAVHADLVAGFLEGVGLLDQAGVSGKLAGSEKTDAEPWLRPSVSMRPEAMSANKNHVQLPQGAVVRPAKEVQMS